MLLDDRVSATRTVTDGPMAAAEPRPRVLLSMSGTGYYGNPGEQQVTEAAPQGEGYVAADRRGVGAGDVARRRRRHPGRPDAHRRGALGQGRRVRPPAADLPARARRSARLRAAVVELGRVARLRRRGAVPARPRRIDGPVNVTSPEPITNADLTKAMGRVLHRPTFTFAPGFALKLPFRDFAEDLLGGQRCVPQRLARRRFHLRAPVVRARASRRARYAGKLGVPATSKTRQSPPSRTSVTRQDAAPRPGRASTSAPRAVRTS